MKEPSDFLQGYFVSPKKILMVCTGNSCRSVLAEAMLKDMLSKEGLDIHVHSAGTDALPGRKAAVQTLDLLKKEGIEWGHHRTQKLTEDMVTGACLVMVMEEKQRQKLLAKMPWAKEKLFLLSDFHPEPERFPLEREIPDPIGMGDFFFENVHEIIRLCCRSLADKLKANHSERLERADLHLLRSAAEKQSA